MPLIIPNGVENLTPADAVELQQNFDAIQLYVNKDVIQRDGSVAMASPLLLAGAPTQVNHAANKGYADTKLDKDGGTMTADLNMGGYNILNMADPESGPQAATKQYVDTEDAKLLAKTGGTMTGILTLDATAGTGANSAMGRQWIRDWHVHTEGSTMTGDLVMGNSPSVSAGMRFGANPPVQFSMASNTPGQPSIIIRRGTSADAVGERFIRFEKGDPPGTIIGRIEVASASTIGYMTSSGAALKERVGDANDALDRVNQLGSQVYRGTWVGDDSTEWDLLNAEDVQVVAPYLVSGEGDEIALNLPGLVPMLLAAVAQLAARVEALEG